MHAAQENGSDVRDWTYVAADGSRRTVSVAVTPRTDDEAARLRLNAHHIERLGLPARTGPRGPDEHRVVVQQ